MNPRSSDRRRFLKTGVTLGAALAADAGTSLAADDAKSAVQPPAPDDPTKVQGRRASPYGERSRFENALRIPQGQSSLAPLQAMTGIITPSALHFERHHAGIPDIDPRRHRLMIHGMVDRPLVLTMDDLKRFPSVSRIYFIECPATDFAKEE